MKKVFALLLTISFCFTLSACESTPTGDPQAIINLAWEKLADKSSSYLSGEIEFTASGNLEVENNKAELSGSGNVQFDNTDKKNVKSDISLALKGKGELEGQKGTVDLKARVRMLEKMMYLFVENVNVDTGDAQTNMMVNLVGNLYKSQWISFPADTMEGPDAVSLESFNGEKVAAIAKKHHFFEVKQDLGNGKYEITINPEKLKSYLKEMGEVNGTPVLDEDLAAIDNLLETIQYTLQVQIDSDYDLTWVRGSLLAKDEVEQQEMNVSFEGTIDENKSKGFIDLVMTGTSPGKARVEFDIEHEEKSVSIEKPENAQTFDPAALFGGGMPEGLPSEDMMEFSQ